MNRTLKQTINCIGKLEAQHRSAQWFIDKGILCAEIGNEQQLRDLMRFCENKYQEIKETKQFNVTSDYFEQIIKNSASDAPTPKAEQK